MLFDSNQEITTDPKKMANMLQEQFSSCLAIQTLLMSRIRFSPLPLSSTHKNLRTSVLVMKISWQLYRVYRQILLADRTEYPQFS